MCMRAEVSQASLALGTIPTPRRLSVLDLFAGVGGLSLGFSSHGFGVTGIDKEPVAQAVFERMQIGSFQLLDLADDLPTVKADIVIGGPPCRPWSSVNVVRRRNEHRDHMLLARFFQVIAECSPLAFLMENVPPLASDPTYSRHLRNLEYYGYSVAAATLKYSDFGAATARRRLFTVGFRDSAFFSAGEFFRRLEAHRAPASTVRQAIWWLRDRDRGDPEDHEWSRLRTIGKYRERYESGRFGWKQLGWDEPAPSFGSVSKTYILHPSAGEGSYPTRVVSVREVLSIMGFDRAFSFPADVSLSLRYRMAANAVSPIVSSACAGVIADMLRHNPALPVVDSSLDG